MWMTARVFEDVGLCIHCTPVCVSCICMRLNITFYLFTQGPPGLAGANGEKVSFPVKFLEGLVQKKQF